MVKETFFADRPYFLKVITSAFRPSRRGNLGKSAQYAYSRMVEWGDYKL